MPDPTRGLLRRLERVERVAKQQASEPAKVVCAIGRGRPWQAEDWETFFASLAEEGINPDDVLGDHGQVIVGGSKEHYIGVLKALGDVKDGQLSDTAPPARD